MRMIRERRALLKPSALVLSLAVLVAACGRDARPPVEADAAPEWTEQVIEPREASDRPPLLVLLHGLGGNEGELAKLAPYVDGRFRIVSLRGPRSYGPGYAWFQIDVLRSAKMRPHPDQAKETLLDLARWLAAAPARLGTDPAKSYVLGFSQGGMMVAGLVRTYPEGVAGGIVLSGSLLDDVFPVAAPATAMGAVPLFVGHGTNDDVLPVDRGRAIRDAFTGVTARVDYHEYPIAHGVNEDVMRDVSAWLTARLDQTTP